MMKEAGWGSGYDPVRHVPRAAGPADPPLHHPQDHPPRKDQHSVPGGLLETFIWQIFC